MMDMKFLEIGEKVDEVDDRDTEDVNAAKV